jgi:hypothetical protein
MREDQRSGCPINLTLEVVGDKWSLLIIRDMIFGNRRHFRELLTKSEEGIASNILADRLKTLVEQGIRPKLWKAFMSELRDTHLGSPGVAPQGNRPGRRSVAARLQAAYEAVVARRKTSAPRRRRGETAAR